jgi:hypothetical protein
MSEQPSPVDRALMVANEFAKPLPPDEPNLLDLFAEAYAQKQQK